MALLAPETLSLGDGDALDSDLVQRVLDLVERERLDDRFDLLHGLPSRIAFGSSSGDAPSPKRSKWRVLSAATNRRSLYGFSVNRQIQSLSLHFGVDTEPDRQIH